MGTHPIFESDFDCLTGVDSLRRIRIYFLHQTLGVALSEKIDDSLSAAIFH